MAENLLARIGGEPRGAGTTYNCGTEVIGLELDILGKEVNFRISLGKGQAKLADIVPLARTLCTKIIDVVLKSIRSDGGHIPCRQGCSPCCSSLIPLSVPEAFRLEEEISAAPEYQSESMRNACFLAARRILSQKPPEPFLGQPTKASHASWSELNLVSSWYASLKLPCPFLCKGLCTIYEQRPLACREHFVEGSARACRGQHRTAEVIEMPVQVVTALAQLAGELEGTSPDAVILPLALLWCRENPDRAERTWPAPMMVKRFVEIIKAMAHRNSAEVVT